MTDKKIYFDHAATTPLHPKVLEKMLPYLKEDFGNPSSIHSFGRKVRVAIEEARETVAEFINANPSEIYFVSGGTEANNFPIFGISRSNLNDSGKNKIISTKAEHHCVLESIDELTRYGFTKELADVHPDSTAKINEIEKLVDNNTSLVSVIHINNETGAENDIKNIARIVHQNDSYFHSDAVQSFSKISIDVKDLGIDALSFSSHKINGPKGIGAVYVKSGTPLSPMIFGGSQERNRRGGTENVAAIVGFAKAIIIAKAEMLNNYEEVNKLRKYFVEGVKNIASEGISINGIDNRFPYILSITFKGTFYNNDAEAMLMFLDINGIAASNGAACTSGTLKTSHVILAMGNTKEDANGTIRFSFGASNTISEIDCAISKLEELHRKFRKQ